MEADKNICPARPSLERVGMERRAKKLARTAQTGDIIWQCGRSHLLARRYLAYQTDPIGCPQNGSSNYEEKLPTFRHYSLGM